MNDVNDLIRQGDVINELKKCNFPTPSVEYINTMKDVEMSNGGRCVKQYKPSVAGLVMRRTGLKMVPVKGGYKV